MEKGTTWENIHSNNLYRIPFSDGGEWVGGLGEHSLRGKWEGDRVKNSGMGDLEGGNIW